MAHKILIVEDEAELLEFIKMRLEAKGYEVVGAADGKEGLEKTYKEKPDLILLDLMLPEIDGHWVCNLLKHDKRYQAIPIIIITAKSDAANMKLAKDCGANEYVVKPFDMNILLSKISGLIK
jgi:DNA-binding response OmpR family regulator